MALVQDVCVSGPMYNTEDAWKFALYNGASERLLHTAGIRETLNRLFERKGFNTRCITVQPTGRRPLRYCIVTDFAVLTRGQRSPKMQVTEWTRRVCKALMSDWDYSVYWTHIRQVVVSGDDIPPFVHYLFKRQLAGERIGGLSPDQTDYSFFDAERAELAARLEAERMKATPKPKTHSPRRYLKELADSRPTSPCPTNDRPPRPTKKRGRKAKDPKKPSSNSSDSDADVEFGYESDAGYYSDITIGVRQDTD